MVKFALFRYKYVGFLVKIRRGPTHNNAAVWRLNAVSQLERWQVAGVIVNDPRPVLGRFLRHVRKK